MGYDEYLPIAARYRVPIVVTGFEPIDILQGVLMCVQQLETGRAEVENQYSRSVRKEGNATARKIVNEVFQSSSRKWRGMGEIPRSGLSLTDAYRQYDATGRVPEWQSASGANQTSRMSLFWPKVYPRTPLGRAYGFLRRRLRGVLSIPAAQLIRNPCLSACPHSSAISGF
jgi:hypothetical protein